MFWYRVLEFLACLCVVWSAYVNNISDLVLVFMIAFTLTVKCSFYSSVECWKLFKVIIIVENLHCIFSNINSIELWWFKCLNFGQSRQGNFQQACTNNFIQNLPTLFNLVLWRYISNLYWSLKVQGAYYIIGYSKICSDGTVRIS